MTNLSEIIKQMREALELTIGHCDTRGCPVNRQCEEALTASEGLEERVAVLEKFYAAYVDYAKHIMSAKEALNPKD